MGCAGQVQKKIMCSEKTPPVILLVLRFRPRALEDGILYVKLVCAGGTLDARRVFLVFVFGGGEVRGGAVAGSIHDCRRRYTLYKGCRLIKAQIRRGGALGQ